MARKENSRARRFLRAGVVLFPGGGSLRDLAAGVVQRLAAADPVDTGTALVAFAAGGPLLLAIVAVLGDEAASATQQIAGALTV